eukprot:CAMPEP_0182478358 /NCGR_PEP_ID=MMETSP1319-20130603/32374_1 /TAXON_ID=172717 /ORGANISM="Bolidomonas pacifica, Strain RCC208" /LENGTH=529 /DNA_ID=CAMNT_0024679689 /DNA_START=240 /DNA_END=1829 /DNA_ORIENTATION=+
MSLPFYIVFIAELHKTAIPSGGSGALRNLTSELGLGARQRDVIGSTGTTRTNSGFPATSVAATTAETTLNKADTAAASSSSSTSMLSVDDPSLPSLQMTFVNSNEKLALSSSSAHCIGNTFTDNAWAHMSCEYRNLCWDRKKKDFLLYRSPEAKKTAERLEKAEHGLVDWGSSFDSSVGVGGINPKWNWANGKEGTYIDSLEWSPTVVDSPLPPHYRVTGSTVVPWHSMAAHNVGHLVWDDMLPIFTLLGMFGLEKEPIFPVRYLLPDPLWASCEFKQLAKCEANFAKFLPLLGLPPSKPPTTETLFQSGAAPDGSDWESDFICWDRGVAGLGFLTDHGKKLHGWEPKDFEDSFNIGRGKLLYDFRSFMIGNLGLEAESWGGRDVKYVTFSLHSSSSPLRDKDFKRQIQAAEEAFEGDDSVVVRSFQFSAMSLEEQVKVTVESTVLVTTVGGGAVTSMFLQKGAGLVLFFSNNPQMKTDYPARLDWDYFNNAAYIRTSWFPIAHMDDEEDLEGFKALLKLEVEAAELHS